MSSQGLFRIEVIVELLFIFMYRPQFRPTPRPVSYRPRNRSAIINSACAQDRFVFCRRRSADLWAKSEHSGDARLFPRTVQIRISSNSLKTIFVVANPASLKQLYLQAKCVSSADRLILRVRTQQVLFCFGKTLKARELTLKAQKLKRREMRSFRLEQKFVFPGGASPRLSKILFQRKPHDSLVDFVTRLLTNYSKGLRKL